MAIVSHNCFSFCPSVLQIFIEFYPLIPTLFQGYSIGKKIKVIVLLFALSSDLNAGKFVVCRSEKNYEITLSRFGK